MAAKILEQISDVELSLEKGVGGVFDVSADGQTVFSKHELGLSKVDDVKPKNVIEKIEEYIYRLLLEAEA